jgi:hypothetical protein
MKAPASEQPTRSPAAIESEREWREFLMSGLPADKVARQETFHEKMEDGQPLSRAERAEMATLEREIVAAAAQQIEAWLRRSVPTSS